MRWRKEFLSSCEIPLTAVECIWSWVRQCPLLPAFSYKGPTLCPGAPSEPANGHSSGYTYAGRFMSWLWCFVSVCVCTWALLLSVVLRTFALDSPFISSWSLVMLLVRVVRVCMIRALSSAFMDLFFSSLDISSWMGYTCFSHLTDAVVYIQCY